MCARTNVRSPPGIADLLCEWKFLEAQGVVAPDPLGFAVLSFFYPLAGHHLLLLSSGRAVIPILVGGSCSRVLIHFHSGPWGAYHALSPNILLHTMSLLMVTADKL